MPDHAAPELPRVALVFGEEAAVAHVREAISGHADIVYATSAADFDAARMAGAGAAAALVNLDSDADWLDRIEACLNDAGVAVVFNDPEISDKLEGWERARWLRHLVAKLRRSNDVDPPRPAAPQPAAHAVDAEVSVARPPGVLAVPIDGAVAERPLSPEEIETMTADFVAEQDSSASKAGPSPRLPASGTAAAPGTAFNAESELDVDTEALSAMIDARLAQPESAPSGSSEVWRVVSGTAESPPQPETLAAPDASSPQAAPAAVSVAGPDRTTAGADQDDIDVLASLPSLDDWQLVDSDTPAVPVAGRKSPEPLLPDSLAGLELLPMETIVATPSRADPIERWLDDGKPAKPKAAPANAARAGTGGGS